MIFDKIFGGKKEEKKLNDVEKIKMAIDKKKSVASQDNNKNNLVNPLVKNQNNVVNQELVAQNTPTLTIQPTTAEIGQSNTKSLSNSSNSSINNTQTRNVNSLSQNIVSQNSSGFSPISQTIPPVQQQKEVVHSISNSQIPSNNLGTNNQTTQSIDLNNLNQELNSLVLNDSPKQDETTSEKRESTLVFGEEHLDTKREEEDGEELFIRLDKYEEIVKTIKLIKDKINENELILERIVNIKKEEDAKLNKWENELRSIYEKIRIIEENLKNVK